MGGELLAGTREQTRSGRKTWANEGAWVCPLAATEGVSREGRGHPGDTALMLGKSCYPHSEPLAEEVRPQHWVSPALWGRSKPQGPSYKGKSLCR